MAPNVFKYPELASAARNFSPHALIAHSASGPLYKGCLLGNQIVAIKLLNSDDGSQRHKQFLVQTLMLNVLQHENLVKLLGYCAEEDHRILVFEFMPLGSLEDQLHARPEPMDWSTRMKIAVGVAKGLEFLHHRASPPVILRDLKPSSILLSEGFEPKLSNFGWAKLGPIGNKTHVSTKVFGTNGYIAPEYATTGQLSIKSDVYSFGVILLELITGRKAIDPSRGAEESNLVIWAHPSMLDEGLFAQLADPMLHGQFPAIGLSQAVALAKMCLEENVASRPPIAEIIPSLDALASRSL